MPRRSYCEIIAASMLARKLGDYMINSHPSLRPSYATMLDTKWVHSLARDNKISSRGRRH